MQCFFPQLSQQTWQTLLTCSDGNILWQFSLGSYFPRRRLESVIAKDSKHPHRCGDWQLHIHLKTLDSSALEPCQKISHGKQDYSSSNCNSRFSNRDSDKWQNVRTAALNIHVYNATVFQITHRIESTWY